tara:strand:- start:1763 stop:2476 length:714 start_codon:yes stop_codon:yes gene_type:complete
MPFTFSHPAIILPFLKNKNMSTTALIVGSMSPDFEYFFRMKMQSEISHTFSGIFLIDFPLGFIVIFAFHEIIKRPLINNLPAFFQKRMQVLKESNWLGYFKNNILIVLGSFFLGTISHIFWDSMTHWDGYIVERIAFFNEVFFCVPVYKMAQHLSSIIGLILIFLYLYNQPYNEQNVKEVNLKYWWTTFGFSTIVFGIRFSFGVPLSEIGSVIVSILFSIMIGITVAGIIFREKKII